MTDQFEKYRALLAGKKLGIDVLVAENEVISGYFRTRRNKSEPWKPLGIWREEGVEKLIVVLGGEDKTDDPKALDHIWPFCLHTPISYETYEAVLGGARWPDLDPTVAAMLEARENRQGIGGNAPPDEAATLLAEVEQLVSGAGPYNKIESDEAEAQAQSLRAALLEKRATAEKKHKAEKEPHLEEGRKVDRKWFPIRDLADDVATRLRKAMQAWGDEKRARARKAAEEEAARKAAEEAAAAAARDPVMPEALVRHPNARQAPAPTEPSPPLAPAAPSGPQQIRGGYGKAASSNTRWTVTAVTDVDEAIAHINMNNKPALEEIRALVMKIAQRAVDAGERTYPGCTVEEKTVIR